MPQNRGLTLLEGSVKWIAPDRSVSSHWPLRSDEQMANLSTSWVSAATIIEIRLAEWKAHCVWKQRRRKQDVTCDTPTSTLWDFGEFLRLDYTHGFSVLVASIAGLLVKTDWKWEISGTSRPSLLCTEHVVRRLWRCLLPAQSQHVSLTPSTHVKWQVQL